MQSFVFVTLFALAGLSLARAEALTLDEVLAAAAQAHPDLSIYQSQVEIARAEQSLAESLDDIRFSLEGTLRTGRNSLTDDKFEPDHQLRLNFRKPIWDGGRLSANAEAARMEGLGYSQRLLDAHAQRRLTVMTRFFDVLLADLAYTATNEYMAAAYVAWDKARDRHQLGELSSAELADHEARYQETLLKRNDALRKGREKRALLASALNKPGELPSELRDPELKGNDRPLPEFEPLLTAMLAHNPRLSAQRQRITASGKRLEAANADNLPVLEWDVELAAYSRDAYTRDNARAGINLVWPLDQGGQSEARRARETAQTRLLEAQLDGMVLELRQALYETREEIQFLRATARRVTDMLVTSRDLSLERAQAEYELEMKTNLGTSMAETQVARLRRRAIEYQLALAWERLEVLLGVPLDSVREGSRK